MKGGRCVAPGIINISSEQSTMEAERLNALANHLSDLRARSADLRRYL